jgi:hypothetical protein
MRQQEPETQTVETPRVQQAWDHLLARVARREARVLVEENGVAVAAIVSPQDLARLEELEQRQRDLATLRASHEGFKDESVNEVERQIVQALAEVRAERSACQVCTDCELAIGRVLFSFADAEQTVLILHVVNRRDAYR